ncbi:hypothetical protein [Stratiformator vulcanicus]|uniref:Uncharacterized protein n=1 Tax=Stratiformator vulcanicus TaxID=2527980 RepID=A0A517QZH4_9PLAN|nr:hypothetical protein [Stratiformator vulcanicus]QDT37004.1 hypothetical protein Pan189_13690 [Stratiformator vulcanicus]
MDEVDTPHDSLTEEDVSHLKILAIVHYVFAGLACLGMCFPAMYIGVGIGAMNGNMEVEGNMDPETFGQIFLAIGIGLAVFILLGAFLQFYIGRSLSTRTNYMFCFVVSAINCLNIPIGTLLGVFTIIVLQRPTVKEAFGQE